MSRHPRGRPGSNSCVLLTLFVQLVRMRNRWHVGDDQQRRVLQGKRMLAELPKRGVEVGALILDSQAR